MTLATPDQAYDLLEELNIAYEKLSHVPITSVENLDFTLPGQQVKNLFLKNRKSRQFYLVILRDEKHADLNNLAEQLGEKKLSFATDDQVESMLRVPPGTVTAFSMIFDSENKIQVIVDADVDQTATVGLHPFINDTTLNISYKDFERIMDYAHHDVQIIDC